MNHFPAPRLAGIAPFHVMELLARAKTLEATGRDIIHMEVGEPDFPTPAPIICAAQAHLACGRVPYTPALGLPTLRQAIADFYQHRYGVRVAAERIVVTAGASAALLLAMACLCSPGSEWLLSDPGYPCNANFIRCFEGVPRHVRVRETENFQPTRESIAAHWNERTAGVLVASPANPTGTLLSQPTLAAIADYVRQHAGQMIVDEIYHGLTYDGDAATALQYGDDLWIVQSFSKYFNMTGWRLGWLVAPAERVRDIEKLAQNLYIAPSTPAQHAALAAFTPETIAILEERRAAFRQRRDFLAPALQELGFRLAVKPEGAFYLYADCRALCADSAIFAHELLEAAGVAVTPGLDFGVNEPQHYLRFAYTTDLARLNEAVQRIRRFLGG